MLLRLDWACIALFATRTMRARICRRESVIPSRGDHCHRRHRGILAPVLAAGQPRQHGDLRRLLHPISQAHLACPSAVFKYIRRRSSVSSWVLPRSARP